MRFTVFALTAVLLPALHTHAQIKKELRYNLSEDGKYFVKATFLNQTWVRYNENNPGSTVFGQPQANAFDIGLRRTRLQLYGQLSPRIFFYTQFGQNNFNSISSRKTGTFFHDVTGEYKIKENALSLGAGLTGWTGFARFSSPGVGSILAVDAPLYQQATNDMTDQFLRKLSVYAKGQLGRLDYRLIVSKPMAYQQSGNPVTLTANSSISPLPPKPQFHGYLMWQFKDKESNQIPYTTGTYLGSKRVFNLGAGFLTQQEAMWRQETAGGDTLKSPLNILNADIYYDVPLDSAKGTALSLYGSFGYFDFGKGYLRLLAPMNVANGLNLPSTAFSGTGTAVPGIGTGYVGYAQAGYLLPRNLLGTGNGALMPYLAAQYAQWDRLESPMLVIDAGVNWLITGHNAKLTLDYQNRPVYDNTAKQTGRRSCYILQFQFFI